ncbi:MAG: DUF1501 domain-containing protein [Myxococcales bacterium]|nr:DUF1501 domain-containing protein [Myxococcales bacterium]
MRKRRKAQSKKPERAAGRLGRREFLVGAAASAGVLVAAPHIWIPNPAIAQTSGRGSIKHLLYIRLSGGFRFQVAFNADVADRFNPFGRAKGVAAGAEWGVGSLLSRSGFLDGEDGMALRELGMKPVPEIADKMTVLACVDHEPLSASADGNHGTGLERYYTGYVDGTVGFFTMINHGMKAVQEQAAAEDRIVLPPFVLGGSAMGRGVGPYAASRPPVLSGGGFEAFGIDSDATIPEWAQEMAIATDERKRDRQHPELRAQIDSFLDTRRATRAYSDIFNSDLLKVRSNSDERVDGITNTELRQALGTSGGANNIALALRLFHYGCPAVYLDQGGYDMHSGEEDGLPGRMEELNRLLSGLENVLGRMEHEAGGSYWDHTMIVLGSEFSRTARGSRFNSARGSDHGGDLATRWMSMPVMGGMVSRPGRQIGATRSSDMTATGEVFSYRSLLKTLLDGLGCDHQEFFPADEPFDHLFA